MNDVTGIRWPQGHEPEGADIHTVNTTVCGEPPERVWSWLVRPDRWSEFYKNARRVRFIDGEGPEVRLDSRFKWITFGAPVTTTVTEFEPFTRLAWTGSGLGSKGHHAWLLRPTDSGGCEIRTEETQRGLVVGLIRPILRPQMVRWHQRWVEGLAAIATESSSACSDSRSGA